MKTTLNKIDAEKKFTIFAAVMIVLMCLSIFLIQNTDNELSEARLKDKQDEAVREANAISKQDSIYRAVTTSSTKVKTLTDEVHGYRNDVVKNTNAQEKSLNNFNQLKNQNEKVYIPNATVDQQSDYISNYKYEPIGAN
jgi:low affinity Fe/Cu permease